MSIASKDDLIKRIVKADIKEFDSELLGKKVRFKRMTAAGSFAVQNAITVYLDNGDAKRDFTFLPMAMIAYSMVDEAGKLMWSHPDIFGRLADMDKEVIEELYLFSADANPQIAGKPEDEREVLSKNQQGSFSTD